MNRTNLNFGQSFKLGRAALDLETFTVSELESLTGIGENTIYSFLRTLQRPGHDYVSSQDLPAGRQGRPPKRYTLTPKGIQYLLSQNTYVAVQLRSLSVNAGTQTEAHQDSQVEPVRSAMDPEAERLARQATTGIGAIRELVEALSELSEGRHRLVRLLLSSLEGPSPAEARKALIAAASAFRSAAQTISAGVPERIESKLTAQPVEEGEEFYRMWGAALTVADDAALEDINRVSTLQEDYSPMSVLAPMLDTPALRSVNKRMSARLLNVI
jgi:DNA-binding PadR family transcriptional regulator